MKKCKKKRRRRKIQQAEILNEENGDRIITIGNKDNEVYLSTILNKLITHEHVFIKAVPLPKYLMKVNYCYSILVNFGVVRIDNPLKMTEKSKKDNGEFEIVVFKWEIIPRIKQWRESLKKND